MKNLSDEELSDIFKADRGAPGKQEGYRRGLRAVAEAVRASLTPETAEIDWEKVDLVGQEAYMDEDADTRRSRLAAYKAVVQYVTPFLATQPQLRPIAEMPEQVPEGCVRVFALMKTEGYVINPTMATPSHAADIRLPAKPADPVREEFEKWWLER